MPRSLPLQGWGALFAQRRLGLIYSRLQIEAEHFQCIDPNHRTCQLPTPGIEKQQGRGEADLIISRELGGPPATTLKVLQTPPRIDQYLPHDHPVPEMSAQSGRFEDLPFEQPTICTMFS